MANRFYYGEKLIRTSKTNTYTHAAININTGECYGCSSTIRGAQANIDRIVNGNEEAIRNAQTAVKALENGKAGFYGKEGRYTYWHKFEAKDTLEKYQRRIADCTKNIEWIHENLRVVELEQR